MYYFYYTWTCCLKQKIWLDCKCGSKISEVEDTLNTNDASIGLAGPQYNMRSCENKICLRKWRLMAQTVKQ